MDNWFDKPLTDCTLNDIMWLIGLAYIGFTLGEIVVEVVDRFVKKKRGNKK